jgi:hypothetical protein
LLKSTLLQLDSTFSERTYGAGSFRDFAQKLAAAGHVVLRESGRNVLVELADGGAPEDTRQEKPTPAPPPPKRERTHEEVQETPPASPAHAEPRTADGIREVRRLFQSAQNPPRWPMYIRQAKQFLRNVDSTFDERKFGFTSLVDLLRACQREGVFRIERDRQGVMRLFPGNVMQVPVDDARDEIREEAREEPAAAEPATPEWTLAPAAETEVVEADVVQQINAPAEVVDGESTPEPSKPDAPPKARGRRRKADAKPSAEKRPRARKTSGARTRTTKKASAA